MRHRRSRRFRTRPNGRNHRPRSVGGEQVRLGSAPFSNGRTRNGFVSHQGAIKLIEKYKNLAKEALSSGDKILSENYYQHADHFMRIAGEKSLNTNQDKNQGTETPQDSSKVQAKNIEINNSGTVNEESKE